MNGVLRLETMLVKLPGGSADINLHDVVATANRGEWRSVDFARPKFSPPRGCTGKVPESLLAADRRVLCSLPQGLIRLRVWRVDVMDVHHIEHYHSLLVGFEKASSGCY